MIGIVSICTNSMSSPTPSVLMTHEMDPTVKIWLGYGRDEEPAEKTILFDKETACTTPTWHANCRQIIIADGAVELIEPVQIDSAPITPAPATADLISEPPPRSPSSTTRRPLPRYQRRRINKRRSDCIHRSGWPEARRLPLLRGIGSDLSGSAPTTLRFRSIRG